MDPLVKPEGDRLFHSDADMRLFGSEGDMPFGLKRWLRSFTLRAAGFLTSQADRRHHNVVITQLDWVIHSGTSQT